MRETEFRRAAHRADVGITELSDHRRKRAVKNNGEQVGFPIMAHVASWLKPRVEAPGVVKRTAFAAIALSQVATFYNFQTHAEEASFDDFPILVHCEVSGVHRAYYLSKIGPDEVAVYVSPDNLAGTITIRGKAEPVAAEGSGSCAGKTLEQLRSTGQAYDLQLR